MVPFHHVLWQVQLEAVLWGIGTALGELPPYFVSRAGRIFCEQCLLHCRFACRCGGTPCPAANRSALLTFACLAIHLSIVFVCDTAQLSGQMVKEFDAALDPANASTTSVLDRMKHWFLTHFHNFGFFAILLFASVCISIVENSLSITSVADMCDLPAQKLEECWIVFDESDLVPGE